MYQLVFSQGKLRIWKQMHNYSVTKTIPVAWFDGRGKNSRPGAFHGPVS